jgi:PAS domain S-box-containing protein
MLWIHPQVVNVSAPAGEEREPHRCLVSEEEKMDARAALTLTSDNELFRAAFNASPIGIAVENLEGQALFANSALCSMLGFSEDEMRGKHRVEFSPPEDAAKDWALFEQLRAGSRHRYQIEKRFLRRDGSLVWGRLTVSRMKGASSLVVAMVEDITEKRTSQEELLRARDDLELVTNQMAAAVTRCSRDFRYLWANQRYADWLQHPLNEIVGRPILDVVGKDAFESLQGYFERVLTGEKVDYEEEVNFNGIGQRWISAAYTPTWDGDPSADGWIAVVLDVTERKRAEAALARHVAIVDSSEDAIICKNLDGVVQSWNAGAERIFGFTEAEAVGQPITFLIPPELRDEEKKILEMLRAGGRIDHYQTIRLTKAGKRLDMSLSLSPIKDSTGRVIGFSKIARDITERKLAQAGLANVSRKLIEAQEQERTRIGRELHDDIGQRLSLLAIQLQQLNENSLILPEVRSSMGELQKQASEIAADIQSLSHELHSAKLQYLGIAGAMRGFCREFGEQQKVKIDFQTRDLPTPLSADISLCLYRVLQEALHNSAKHSGVRHFEVQLWGTSDQIHLTVRDSGAGFDREAAKTSRGLGLVSMEERVKLLNGTLLIESQPKSGTAIHARIPFTSSRDSALAAG